MIDECNNKANKTTFWVVINTIDGWGNNKSSNKFNVIISPITPSAILNKFDHIIVYQNHYIETELPDYLFFQNYQIMASYVLSNWIDNSTIKIAARIKEKDKKKYLFVKVFGDTGWQLSIYSTDSYWQTSEILLNVTVLKWSSKEWFEWSGPSDSDCISWNTGYVLNSDKSWVKDVSYLPITNTRLYWICGLIAMVVNVFYIVLSLRYGKLMLEPAVHLQTLMMLVLSTDWVNDGWIEYISWIQYFKFDFSFLNFYWLNNWIQWTPSSNRFSNAKIYWQEAMINYFSLIMLILLIAIILRIMKLWKLSLTNKLLKYIDIKPESKLWLCWWIIMPFLIVNIYNDLATYRHHLRLSLLSVLTTLLICIYWLYKRLSFFSNTIVQNINPDNSLNYIYMSLIIRIPIVIIYLSQVQIVSYLMMILIFIINSGLLISWTMLPIKLALQQTFSRATEIFGNSIMQLVITIIAFDKVSLQNKYC